MKNKERLGGKSKNHGWRENRMKFLMGRERDREERNLESLCWVVFGVWPGNVGGVERNIFGSLRVNMSISHFFNL